MKKYLWIAAVLMVVWAGYVGLVYAKMQAAPASFNRFMAGVPMPAMIVVPFETLWFRARGGTLQVGDAAPDFELKLHHGEQKVRLSASRGVRPVMLVFGSYT